MSHISGQRSDAALVRAARAGETASFASLVERHFGLVHFIALARLSDAEAAEDLAQEVFLRAFVSLGSLRHPERFPAWLAQITRNLAINWLRRDQRRSELVPLVPLDSVAETAADARTKGGRERMVAQEQSDALRRALADLSPDLREMVLLHFAENLTQHQIAERLGVNQTTVSRRIQRALTAMRGALEPALRESAPRLRPAHGAAVKTIAVITAAGAMSATAKATLAATAAASGGSATAAKASGVAGLLGLIQSIPALVAGGGAAMGAGKGIAAVVAVGAIAGGAYIYTSGGGGSGSPSTPSPSSPAPPPTLPTPVQARTPVPPADWAQWMREFARSQPDNEGLLHLVNAVEQFDWQAMMPMDNQIREIVRTGWRGQQPQIFSLLQSQASAVREALAAADAEDIEFPTASRPSDPIPNFLSLQMMFRLILADARRLEAAGEADRAAMEAVQVLCLAEHLCADNTFLIQQLIGIAGQGMALDTLASILRHPALSEEVMRGIGGELDRIDRVREGVVGGLRSEARVQLETMRRLADGTMGDEEGITPDMRRAYLSQMGSFEAFAAEHERIWGTLLANAERPFYERENLDQDWIASQSTNELIRIAIPNFLEASVRDDVVLAKLRLCRTLASLRDGIVLGVDMVALDPFSGQPVLVSDTQVWSVGPDQADQGGRVSYDSTNGTISAGDVVVAR
ncbi:RNA polymerase sigma factor [Candidatus Sumerlaeota bacterium]|nr:RNA polymerase sigma factor [Candidatus Sumerlaeota bacterium]